MNCYWTNPRQDSQYIAIAGKRANLQCNMGRLPRPCHTIPAYSSKTKSRPGAAAWCIVASVSFDLALHFACVCPLSNPFFMTADATSRVCDAMPTRHTHFKR